VASAEAREPAAAGVEAGELAAMDAAGGEKQRRPVS
jgi:hypothetical protein